MYSLFWEIYYFYNEIVQLLHTILKLSLKMFIFEKSNITNLITSQNDEIPLKW